MSPNASFTWLLMQCLEKSVEQCQKCNFATGLRANVYRFLHGLAACQLNDSDRLTSF